MQEQDDEVEKIVCTHCESEYEANDIYESASGDALCYECAICCERCGIYGTDDDSWREVDGNYTWCEDCANNHAYWCDGCETYDSEGTCYVNGTGSSYCSSCLNDYYYCDYCNEWYEEECDCSDERIIHDYSYRPDPIFHSANGEITRLYFGLEIEMEHKDESYSSRDEAAQFASDLEKINMAYNKSDGSLSCGFELVTHPMSFAKYKEQGMPLWSYVNQLRDNYGMRAWNTKTCGLHIHISRAGFNGGSHMHRFLNLVYSNQEFYEKIAGRSSTRWASFDDCTFAEYNGDQYINHKSFKHKFTNHGSERYSAVNTNNRNTLEMRIFRGSLSIEKMKSYLDLAHASVEYTRTLSVRDIQVDALCAENLITYIMENKEIYPDLVQLMTIKGLVNQTESV